jgi:prophage DNA circulation protein
MGIFDDDTAVLTDYDAWAEAYQDLDETVTDYRNGVAEPHDVSRTMSSFRAASTALIETIDDMTEYRENAEVVTSSAYRMVRVATQLVDTLLSKIPASFEVQIINWSDIFSVCLDYYGDTEKAEEITTRNGIIDPLAIEPGTVLTLPYAGVS